MEESSTRQSSKLSLGSSPSVLSEGDDDPLELDATLSALEDDDDDLSALNSILQTGSPGSLSNEEVLDDDLQSDNSSLSSAPDDFPLSRSASPEAPEEVSRKRKGEQPDQGPSKRSKAEESVEGQEEKGDGSETDSKNELKEEKKEIPERKEEEDEKEKEDEKKVGIDLQEGKEEEKMDSEIAENDEDYQQRHKEALDALTHIELEFARLRDKMYQEKMSELNDEALMIANGTHPELVSLMAEIEEKKGKRISSAEAWREHQYANFKKQRDLLSDIHNKKWSMENERKKLNEVSTDRLLLFPDGREMMLHKRELKEETSELSEMKETIGFPMAPNPKGLNSQDIDEDLRLLDLLCQFDKKRSQLHFELGLLAKAKQLTSKEPNQHTSSLKNLFNKSSAFIKSKIESLRNLASIEPSAKKVMMKTTIHFEPRPHTQLTPLPFMPPTITHYPPKPLVYSPIEPLQPPSNKQLLFHRLSMPLMKAYNHHSSDHRFIRRRKSEPENKTKK
ncbi:hypothetical protein G6F57_013117 [Rhizopus arrhizus]|nr:hypothetical protein G6F16_011583 [Rhizopus arrhizus]KAG0959314.1 hypothetical protein G6F31_011778 [Rhizopus arrhizus]KAG0974448.1 hypothetical protein G6F29_012206 [Rhizopus arrhizus]KAG1282154.1 hypothetical protein G6F66_011213 [Rhizopus arrhizus]KAG1467224.1 hypothetical protein G6F57_013117 [Rhizopus arrhizus]